MARVVTRKYHFYVAYEGLARLTSKMVVDADTAAKLCYPTVGQELRHRMTCMQIDGPPTGGFSPEVKLELFKKLTELHLINTGVDLFGELRNLK